MICTPLSARSKAMRLMLGAVILPLLALPGCVSIGSGSEPPAVLLTLRASQGVGDNDERSSSDGQPLVVNLPSTPRLLDSLRVPVRVNDTSAAYVKQAFWADKPSRLFLALLKESLTARTDRLVLPADEAKSAGSMVLSGTLSEFGYDVDSAQAVATYDALLRNADGEVSSRRFRASAPVAAVEPALIGEGLNAAANTIAADVATWVEGQL